MKEERGNINGDQTIAEKYELWGKISGDVRVVEGGKFYMRGAIYGDLMVEYAGRVHIYGHVSGNLTIYRGSKVIVSGIISGNATNEGGRLYIDRDGQVLGRIFKNKGETSVEIKDVME